MSHTLSNVNIEVLTGTGELADKITREVESKFYSDNSVITHIYSMEALRDDRF